MMKAKDAARAAGLVAAHEGLPAVSRACRLKGKPDATDGDRYSFVLGVHARCDAGGVEVAEIEIDLKTARAILPLVLDVMGDELAALGISPPKVKL
jgi:hypothetical protein